MVNSGKSNKRTNLSVGKIVLAASISTMFSATLIASPVPPGLEMKTPVSGSTVIQTKNQHDYLPQSQNLPESLNSVSKQDQDTSFTNEFNIFNIPFEDLLELKVTSVSFFPRSILTQASTVSVIERHDWEANASRRMLDSLVSLPGTHLSPWVFGMNIFAIRGYTDSRTQVGVATRLDGIPMNELRLGSGQISAQNIQLGVLDKIEVVRGPGSALYGSDAFHGVISMHTFESEQDITRMTAEGGVDNYYQTSLQHSAGFGNGARINLAMAASGEYLDRSYYIADSFSELPLMVEQSESTKSKTATLKTHFNLSSTLKLTAGMYFDEYDTTDGPCCIGVLDDTLWNSTTQAGQLIANQQLSGASSLEARIYHVENTTERFAASISLGTNLGDTEASTDVSRSGVEVIYRQPQTGWFNTEVAFGIGYELGKFNDGSIVFKPVDNAGTTFLDFPGQGSERELSYFLLDARSFLPDERWALSYGGRYDDYSDAGSEFTPRLGLVFQPAEYTAFKLLFNKAFRAPTLGERDVASGGRLDPETLDSYEFVFLTGGQHWSTEWVVFKNKWNDGITFAIDPSLPNGFTYRNTGKNEAQGVEASFNWRPTSAWRAEITASYLTSQNVITGQYFEKFPKTKASISVERKFESINAQLIINNHFFDKAKDGFSAAPSDIPFYWRTDVVFKKSFSEALSLYCNIINLFDRDNRISSVLSFNEGVSDRPFSMSVGFRYRM